MKKINILVFTLFSAILFLSNLDGALPENTGAPDELTCGRAPCHNVNVNIGNAQISIEYSDASLQYFADSIFILTVSITDPQTIRNGFQILALDENNQNVGTWQLLEPAKMKIISGIGLPDRKYVTHQAAGNQQTEWSLEWVAPSASMGVITFYASVNSTNNNGMNTGDEVYTTSLSVDFAETVSAKELFASEISVYPVPAREGVWLDLPGGYGVFQCTLIAAGGIPIRDFSVTEGSQHYIETQALPGGLYFLKLEAATGQILFKKMVIL